MSSPELPLIFLHSFPSPFPSHHVGAVDVSVLCAALTDVCGHFCATCLVFPLRSWIKCSVKTLVFHGPVICFHLESSFLCWFSFCQCPPSACSAPAVLRGCSGCRMCLPHTDLAHGGLPPEPLTPPVSQESQGRWERPFGCWDGLG